MFKFIFATLTLMIAAAAAAAAGNDVDYLQDAYDGGYDNAANSFDYGLGYDNADDSMGFRYSDDALEDNINIAVKAAILDKYGQAIASESPDLRSKPRGSNRREVSGTAVRNTPKSPRPTTAYKPAKTVSKSVARPTVRAVKEQNFDDGDTITHFVRQVNPDGTYGFDFRQSSGLEFREMGQGGVYAEGSYQYISPEGEHISVTYTADENGFHAESDSIPTPPPVPAYILRALDYIRDHPTAEELADREVRARQI